MNNEELNFLKEELKKIEKNISDNVYSSSYIDGQIKMWELRDKIKGEIRQAKGKNEARVN
jgi:hypothetical protein